MDLQEFSNSYWDAKDDSVDHERLNYMVELLDSHESTLIVDGGPGFLARKLLDAGQRNVRQTDLSSVACARAQERGVVSDCVDTDKDRLPFGDAAFDCVISDSALEHRYYPEKGLSECTRVLRDGGTLLLTLPNVAHWRHRLQLLRGSFPEVVGGPTDRCHLRMFALPQVRGMLRAEGLVIEKTRGFSSLWVKGLYPSLFRAPGVGTIYKGLTRLRPSVFGRDLILLCRKSS